MTRRLVAPLSVLTFLLAFAPSAFAASNITVVAGGGTVNNSGSPNFTPTGTNSQVGADLITARLNTGANVALNTTSASADPGTITVSAAISPTTPNNAHLTLTAASTVTLGASISVPALAVTSGGDISQAGGTIVAPTASFDPGTSKDATLTAAGNDFGTLTSPNVGSMTVTDVNAITLGAMSVNSIFTLTSGGAVTQSAAVNLIHATIDSGTSAITLNNPNNIISTIEVVHGGNVNVASSFNLALDGDNIGGNLTASAPGLNQSAALAVTGSTSLTAGANGIDLTNAGNNFSTVALSSAAGAAINDSNNLTLAAVGTTGDFSATAGGPLDQSAAASVGGSTNVTGSPVQMTQAANDFTGPVSILNAGGSGAVIDANDLTLGSSQSTGALSFSAGDDLTVQPNATIAVTGGTLRLVADRQNPAAPAIGTGSVTVGANAALSGSSAVRLYAARRSDNSVDPTAQFNGATFTPGALYVPSDREQWGVYSPAGTATAPFTFFYKDNDTTAPTITLSAPTDGATYTAGDSVAASYGCADDGQVASCAGPVANGAAIDTASAGTKTFTVDATDGQGNHASKTVTYTVVAAAPAPAPPATPEPPVVVPPVPVKQSLHATVTVLRRTAKLHRGRKPRLVTGIVVSCPAGLPQSCGGSGKVTANVPARLTARTVTIGKLGFAVKPGTSHTVVINLTPRGARILARIHSVRITLAVTTHGQDGKRVVTTRRVTLRLR